jgi:hypothetical protein
LGRDVPRANSMTMMTSDVRTYSEDVT